MAIARQALTQSVQIEKRPNWFVANWGLSPASFALIGVLIERSCRSDRRRYRVARLPKASLFEAAPRTDVLKVRRRKC